MVCGSACQLSACCVVHTPFALLSATSELVRSACSTGHRPLFWARHPLAVLLRCLTLQPAGSLRRPAAPHTALQPACTGCVQHAFETTHHTTHQRVLSTRTGMVAGCADAHREHGCCCAQPNKGHTLNAHSSRQACMCCSADSASLLLHRTDGNTSQLNATRHISTQ